MKRNLKKHLLIGSLGLLIFACSTETKYDTSKWNWYMGQENFKIAYPADWKLIENPNKQMPLIILSPNFIGHFGENIQIKKVQKKNFDIKSIFHAEINKLGLVVQKKAGEINTNNNTPAYYLEHQYTHQKVDISIIRAFIAGTDEYIIITCSGHTKDYANRYRELFELCIRSFSFI